MKNETKTNKNNFYYIKSMPKNNSLYEFRKKWIVNADFLRGIRVSCMLWSMYSYVLRIKVCYFFSLHFVPSKTLSFLTLLSLSTIFFNIVVFVVTFGLWTESRLWVIPNYFLTVWCMFNVHVVRFFHSLCFF